MAAPFTSGPQGPAGPATNLSSLQVAGVPTMGMGGGIDLNGGQVFFVSSVNGSDGFAGTYSFPFATTAQALTQCVADRGDTICWLSGHAETVSAAAGQLWSVNGVTFQSLGNGNDRATFTFGTSASASIRVTGANVTVIGVVGISNINSLTSPWDIRAAGFTGFLEWQDASAKEAVTVVACTAAANRLNLTLVYRGLTGGTGSTAVVTLNGSTGAIINCDFYGKASTAYVNFITAAVSDVEVYGYMYNSGVTNGSKDIVDTITGSTWFGSIYDGSAGAPYQGGSAAAWASVSVAGISSSATTAAAGAYRIAKTGTITAATSFTTGASPVTLFTVTGDVVCRVYAVIVTGLTSTLATGTLAVGTSGATGTFLGATTVNGTNLNTSNSVWTGATSGAGGGTTNSAVFSNTALNFALDAASSNIICTIATNSMTAGTLYFYCEWKPVSANGNVVNAL